MSDLPVKPQRPSSDAGEWENEGGSMAPPPANVLPAGVVAVVTTTYRVGPYSYASLPDAIAEHERQAAHRVR